MLSVASMIRSTLSTLAFVTLSAFAAACGGQQPEAAAPTAGAKTAPATGVKEPGDAKVGDTAKCPVSGEEFTVEASSPKAEHDGKTYYFCCGGCKKKFEADPAKYVKKS
jgi:Cu+-exporting ATPase